MSLVGIGSMRPMCGFNLPNCINHLQGSSGFSDGDGGYRSIDGGCMTAADERHWPSDALQLKLPKLVARDALPSERRAVRGPRPRPDTCQHQPSGALGSHPRSAVHDLPAVVQATSERDHCGGGIADVDASLERAKNDSGLKPALGSLSD